MRYYSLTNAQVLFSRKPRPPQCSLVSLALVSKVTPPRSSKNPRSANVLALVATLHRGAPYRTRNRIRHRMPACVWSVSMSPVYALAASATRNRIVLDGNGPRGERKTTPIIIIVYSHKNENMQDTEVAF